MGFCVNFILEMSRSRTTIDDLFMAHQFVRSAEDQFHTYIVKFTAKLWNIQDRFTIGPR